MEHQSFSTGFIIGLLCAALIAGVAVFLFKKKRHPKQDSRADYKGNQSSDSTQNHTSIHKIEVKQINISEIPIDGTLIEPYLERKFASSIGSLWQIANFGDEYGIAKLTFDNLDISVNAIGSPELKKEWESFVKDRSDWDESLYMDKASILISLFKSIGVEIIEDSPIVWTQKSHFRYRSLANIENGTKCKVLSPCVIYGSSIIDQGLVEELK